MPQLKQKGRQNEIDGLLEALNLAGAEIEQNQAQLEYYRNKYPDVDIEAYKTTQRVS